MSGFISRADSPNRLSQGAAKKTRNRQTPASPVCYFECQQEHSLFAFRVQKQIAVLSRAAVASLLLGLGYVQGFTRRLCGVCTTRKGSPARLLSGSARLAKVQNIKQQGTLLFDTLAFSGILGL